MRRDRQTISVSEPRNLLVAIRRRPAMYIGGMDMSGLINYLLSPVAMLLAHGAKRIDVTVNDGFEIGSDVVIAVEQTDDGRITPFQELRPPGTSTGYQEIEPVSTPHDYPDTRLTMLNALSEQLSVSVDTGALLQKVSFIRGDLESYSATESTDYLKGTVLRFEPDCSIFTVTDLSPAILTSYLRRFSYFHEGVRFTLTQKGDRHEFFVEDGIAELFTAISTPYQLMHEPIHIVAHEGSLDLKVVMAYHNWKTNHLWSFINNGRAVKGGTHEQGLTQGLKRLREKLDLTEDFNNGVVAVAFMRYPGATWDGATRHKISNFELKRMVSRLVVSGVALWLEKRPDVETQIRQLQTFSFPDTWNEDILKS